MAKNIEIIKFELAEKTKFLFRIIVLDFDMNKLFQINV